MKGIVLVKDWKIKLESKTTDNPVVGFPKREVIRAVLRMLDTDPTAVFHEGHISERSLHYAI